MGSSLARQPTQAARYPGTSNFGPHHRAKMHSEGMCMERSQKEETCLEGKQLRGLTLEWICESKQSSGGIHVEGTI